MLKKADRRHKIYSRYQDGAQDGLISGHRIWCDNYQGVLRPIVPANMKRLVFNSLAPPGICATRKSRDTLPLSFLDRIKTTNVVIGYFHFSVAKQM